MFELRGQRVSEGIAIGPAVIFTSAEIRVKASYVRPERVDNEIRRFRRAVSRTEHDITALLDRDDAEESVDVRNIILTTRDFLRDEALLDEIEQLVRGENYAAPYAVSTVIGGLAERLQAIDNPTFSSKVADMIDIEHRLLNHLLGGRRDGVRRLDRQSIIVADDLSPTQAVQLDRSKVLALVTEKGSWASHTAILARALGIPAVVAVHSVSTLSELGGTVIVDGYGGNVVIDPDSEILAKYRQIRRRARRRALSDIQSSGLPAITRDGAECKILCNIETKEDIDRAMEYGAEGVGLFRTEYLFLGQANPPGEEEQYEVYRAAAERLGDLPLTIRSCDFGADKFDRIHGGGMTEPNPFMGERAIRISLKQTDFFRTQLRAVLRAAKHGKVKLMFPMVMDTGDMKKLHAQLDTARNELRERGIEPGELEVGAMLELPAAIMNSEGLAGSCDFFSIGTNDLTQYALGVDRTNQRVARLYAPHHPGVSALIQRAVHAGGRMEREVSVCGEMAGEPLLVPLLLGLGVRTFSVASPQIPAVRRTLRSVHLTHCEKLAEQALSADGADEVLRLLRSPGRRVTHHS